MNDAAKTTIRDEGHGVVAMTLDSDPHRKVQVAPEHGHGTFGAFASIAGVGCSYFCGRSYKTRASALKAAERWLRAR